jgi:hypothetical protein
MPTVEVVPASDARNFAARPALASVPDVDPRGSATTEPLGPLPAEWRRVEAVRLGETTIDSVLVGPNGVFAVSIDPDLRTAAVRPGGGLIRAGTRQPHPVKTALLAAAALRARLASVPGAPFPYPVLVTNTPGEDGHRLGRLLVVRPGRFAEVLWNHLSRPLTRSERIAVEAALEAGAAG